MNAGWNSRRGAGSRPEPERTRRAAGTRARVPEPRPGRVGQVLWIGVALLTLSMCLPLLPQLNDWAQGRVRRAPFLLERVSAQGLQRISATELADAVDMGRGVPLVDLDVDAVAERVRAHPWVAQATVTRIPPSTLLVGIQERIPLAVTQAGDPALPYVVDARGVAFAPATAWDQARLVSLVLPAPVEPGVADAELAEGLRLAAELPQRGLAVPREIVLGLPQRRESAALDLRGDIPGVVLERQQVSGQLDRLAQLLAASLPESRSARWIDLRFADQAVLRGGAWELH